MANYGDVALGLKASWNRNNYEVDNALMFYTVGHADGVADARLKAEPDKLHQFKWIEMKDMDEVTRAKMRHFTPVHKDDWDKNDMLWSWDAEGYIWHAGQRLYAREKQYWLAEQAKRDNMFESSRDSADREMDNVPLPDGSVVFDAKNEPRKRGRPRKGI